MKDFPKVFSYNYLGVYINKKKIEKNKIQKTENEKKGERKFNPPSIIN